MDITCKKCLQDGDHTDGHYITLFTEQLTRTFEVLALSQESLSSLSALFSSKQLTKTLQCLFKEHKKPEWLSAINQFSLQN